MIPSLDSKTMRIAMNDVDGPTRMTFVADVRAKVPGIYWPLPNQELRRRRSGSGWRICPVPHVVINASHIEPLRRQLPAVYGITRSSAFTT